MLRRNGFTLVEVLVALTLGGLAAGLVAGVFQATTGSLRALEGRGDEQARLMNGSVWLAEVLLSIRPREPGRSSDFEGAPDGLGFTAWDQVPRGWSERARIRVERADGRLVATGLGARMVLVDSLGESRFEYLGGEGADAPWLPAWTETGALPRAVRLRVKEPHSQAWDTLLFRVGGGP